MPTNNTNTQHNSNNIVAFSFEKHEVRGFEYQGEPYFIGNEVAAALGYASPKDAVSAHCKALKLLKSGELALLGIQSGPRGMNIIPERDVYRLVMRSNLPTAEAFEEKVVGEILPAIRKTGGYMLAAPEETPEQLALRAMQVLQDTVARQKAELAEAAPQIDAYKKLASLDGVHNLRSAAQQCGWPERKFIQQLCQMRWIYTHNVTGRKCAYADKVKAGLMEAKNVEVKRTGYVEGVGQPMITQEGLAELRSILGPYEAHTRAEAMKTEIAKRSQSRKAARKPFYENTSVSAVTASHPFEGGNAGVRMNKQQIADAILDVPQAFPEYRKRYGGDPEKGKQTLRQAARAIMQLWHDLEEDDRAGVGRKALA